MKLEAIIMNDFLYILALIYTAMISFAVGLILGTILIVTL
jgi:hypothetical protein